MITRDKIAKRELNHDTGVQCFVNRPSCHVDALSTFCAGATTHKSSRFAVSCKCTSPEFPVRIDN